MIICSLVSSQAVIAFTIGIESVSFSGDTGVFWKQFHYRRRSAHLIRSPHVLVRRED